MKLEYQREVIILSISFAKFILQYLDEWNLEVGCLCDDLGISSHTLNDWTHRGQIPSLDSIEIIKNYFQEDFKGVVFDGRGFRRKFKVIRTDGSSEIYPTMQQIVWDEGISYTTIIKCLQEDVAIGRGKHKGYHFPESLSGGRLRTQSISSELLYGL